jgi:hypothetical protein
VFVVPAAQLEGEVLSGSQGVNVVRPSNCISAFLDGIPARGTSVVDPGLNRRRDRDRIRNLSDHGIQTRELIAAEPPVS